MRLLPDDCDLGWTPYAWLIYLGLFWMGALVPSPSAQHLWLTALGTALFLPLYFWGYWQNGRRVLWATAGMTLLGILYGPINWGANVFFVYGAAYLGYAGSASFAFRCLVLVASIPALEAWWLDLPPYFWIPGTVFSMLVGAINIHHAGVRRSQAELRRSQEQVERLAKLAERERIARDLHDLLGHTLTVITRKAELARKLSETDPLRAAREVHEIEDVARQALKEVRGTVTGYRLTDLATEVSQARVALQTAGIHAETHNAPVTLDENREHVLALALREATTNVLRHSGADTCWIKLDDLGDAVRLVVRDNGRGGRDAEGAGLYGMRERVSALGGTVDRERQGGTALTVTLPTGDGRVARSERAVDGELGPGTTLLPSEGGSKA